jgi:hypothetical protein
MSRDAVKEIAAAVRLFKRCAAGEMSFLEMMTGTGGDKSNVAPVAGEGEARCEKDSSCLGSYGHEGGCIFDAPIVENNETVEVEHHRP